MAQSKNSAQKNEVQQFLLENPIQGLSIDNFNFARKSLGLNDGKYDAVRNVSNNFDDKKMGSTSDILEPVPKLQNVLAKNFSANDGQVELWNQIDDCQKRNDENANLENEKSEVSKNKKKRENESTNIGISSETDESKKTENKQDNAKLDAIIDPKKFGFEHEMFKSIKPDPEDKSNLGKINEQSTQTDEIEENSEIHEKLEDLYDNLVVATNVIDLQIEAKTSALESEKSTLEAEKSILEAEKSNLEESLIIATNERDLIVEENENLIDQRDLLAEKYDDLVDHNQQLIDHNLQLVDQNQTIQEDNQRLRQNEINHTWTL